MVRALARDPREIVDGWGSRCHGWCVALKGKDGELISHRSDRCWRGLPGTAAAAAAGAWSWHAIARHDSYSRENDCQGKSGGKYMYIGKAIILKIAAINAIALQQ